MLLEIVLDWNGFERRGDLFYNYVDYTLDTGEPFYVGKGNLYRVGSRRQRVVVAAHEPHDETAALNRERELIHEHNTFMTEHGCNFTQGGDGTSGFKHSQEARQRMSDSRKGRIVEPDAVRRIADVNRGQQRSNVTRQKISLARKNTSSSQRTALERLHRSNKGRTPSDDARQRMKFNQPRRRKVDQMTSTGVLLNTFDSINYASRATGVHHSSIIACCQGKLQTAGGFTWRYASVSSSCASGPWPWTTS
jgi:hypothetical protein